MRTKGTTQLWTADDRRKLKVKLKDYPTLTAYAKERGVSIETVRVLLHSDRIMSSTREKLGV